MGIQQAPTGNPRRNTRHRAISVELGEDFTSWVANGENFSRKLDAQEPKAQGTFRETGHYTAGGAAGVDESHNTFVPSGTAKTCKFQRQSPFKS